MATVCVLLLQLPNIVSDSAVSRRVAIEADLQRLGCAFAQVDATAHGAIGNGLVDDTRAIQAAIDAAAAQTAAQDRVKILHNGTASSSKGCAVLRSGVFVSGTVFLRPYVTLYIDRTAVLKASLNHTAFVPDHDWPGQAALVAGYNADDSGVAGHGVIDGQAPMFVTSIDPVTDQFIFGEQGRAYPVIDRVRLVDFAHSRRVSVQDVSIIDSTGFHVHLYVYSFRMQGFTTCK